MVANKLNRQYFSVKQLISIYGKYVKLDMKKERSGRYQLPDLHSYVAKGNFILMNKIILALNHHKVIDAATEKIEEHLSLTFELENELPKYLDYLRLYLEDKLSKLTRMISQKHFGKREPSKSKSNTLDASDRA